MEAVSFLLHSKRLFDCAQGDKAIKRFSGQQEIAPKKFATPKLSSFGFRLSTFDFKALLLQKKYPCELLICRKYFEVFWRTHAV